MKQLFSFFFVVLSLTSMQAQVPGQGQGSIHPVDWTGTVKKESDGTYDLIFKGKIKEGWHIFSQFTAEGGSLPMKIEFLDDGKDYKTNGKTEESKTKTQYNDVFEVDETIFEHKAVLTQNISLNDPDLRYVKAQMSYQVCQESCINEEYYFVFDLQEKKAQIFNNYDKFKSFAKADNSGESNQSDQSNTQKTGAAAGAMTGMPAAQGNMKSPVSWKGNVEKESDKSFDLIFKAKIKEGWHIFSQFTAEGGSLPMKVEFLDEDDAYKTNGKAKESKTTTQFNDVFDVDETIFEDKAVITQNITLNDPDRRYIKAQMNYQVCQESCINQEYYFVFDLKDQSAKVFSNYDKFKEFGQGGKKESLKEQVKEGNKEIKEGDEKASSSGSDRNLSVIFILAFLWGFAALLTPCVFPMIPMTVSFFTKQSKTKAKGRRNAILYSIFIIVIYVILGTLIVGIFGADSLNKLSTNVIFNIAFFLLLVVFAVSFLGAFEIVLPSSWANKVDKQADRGGIIGIFFMALALAIVSFSCTGPIIGTLLVQAASHGGLAPIVGMFAFSLALAIPFGLFALFPSWLNSLPKSGGWLNAVKVVLGLLELALAFKFLSNADLVVDAGFLTREVYLSIWITIFGLMAFYLFGKILLPNDSKIERIGVGRFMMGMLVMAFTIYMIPGLWGAPLKILSGYLPPENYAESPHGVGNTKKAAVSMLGAGKEIPEGMKAGPQDIMSFRDFDKGMAYAKKIGKPVMLDFTGKACVNCRKMEDRVWSEENVKNIMTHDVVLISLYVDVKKKLPEDEQYTSKTTGKRIRTVGNKWSDFQIKRYQMNAQPYYVIVDPDTGEDLNNPVGYTPDADEYEAWLKKGIEKYQEKK